MSDHSDNIKLQPNRKSGNLSRNKAMGSRKTTNVLLGIIITMLTGFAFLGWAFRNEAKADIASVQKSLNKVSVNQGIFNEKLIQNEREHREIFEVIRNDEPDR